MSHYASWYCKLVRIGIAVNLLFVIPLAFAPNWFLGLLKIPLDQPIWGQAAAMLLFIISVFYVPGAIDPDRYRVTAWMHVFPSRTCGSTFFIVAVLFFGHPLGFLSIALVDAFFGLSTLYCLVKMTEEEQAQQGIVKAEGVSIYPPWVGWLVKATAGILVVLILGLARQG
jgi:hypothetical protein